MNSQSALSLDALRITIGWMSNSSYFMSSGYATQTGVWTRALKKPGQDNIQILAFRGIEGRGWRNPDGILEWPRSRDAYMNDIIQTHVKALHLDLVFTLIDVWALSPLTYGQLPWAAWIPIDSSPIVPHAMQSLDSCRWPIAMSRFGKAELESSGYRPLYVPHGLDGKVFYPREDRSACRKLLSALTKRIIPDDTFLVIEVAANGEGIPSRKNFSATLRAWRDFHEAHPDSLLYLHTDPLGVHGEPLSDMVVQYGVGDSVLFPPSYDYIMGRLEESLLAEFYCAADAFILLSRGEGFGLPIIESQLCGTPVIVTDFAAGAELCLAGWKVGGHLEEHYPLSHQMWVHVDEAAQRLTDAYGLWKGGKMPALREEAAQKALAYEVENVLKDHMLPALLTIQDELARGVSRAPAHQKKTKPWTKGEYNAFAADYENRFKKA